MAVSATCTVYKGERWIKEGGREGGRDREREGVME